MSIYLNNCNCSWSCSANKIPHDECIITKLNLSLWIRRFGKFNARKCKNVIGVKKFPPGALVCSVQIRLWGKMMAWIKISTLLRLRKHCGLGWLRPCLKTLTVGFKQETNSGLSRSSPMYFDPSIHPDLLPSSTYVTSPQFPLLFPW